MTGTREPGGAPGLGSARSAALLDLADRVLRGSVRMPHGTRARAAAVLARTALEDVVTALCLRHGLDVSGTTMRVRLACLLTVSQGVAGTAAVAWWGLSRACHQHAYEIAPHHLEVAHLIRAVRALAREALAPPSTRSSR